MNRTRANTLAAIFTDPVSPAIRWADIEKLFVSIGCQTVEGSGSRVRFEKDGVVASFHRPHPKPTAKRYQVRAARDYLTKLGVKP